MTDNSTRQWATDLYLKGYRADHIEAIKERYGLSHALAVEVCDVLADMEMEG